MTKIFAEVGFYELHIRPFKEGDKPLYYHGVGGLFETRRNEFRSFDACMNHLEKKRFDDCVCVHKTLEPELSSRYDIACEFQTSDDGEWFTFYVR